MHQRLASLFFPLLVVWLAGFGRAQDEGPVVRWQGKPKPALEVLELLSPEHRDPVQRALTANDGWARERGYAWTLPSSGSMLLMHSAKLSKRSKAPKLVDETLERFEVLFPAGAAPEQEEPEKSVGAEDEFGDAFGGAFGGGGPAQPEAEAWNQAPVLFVLDDDEDLSACLDYLVQGHPYLDAWVNAGAKAQAGFLLGRPLVGGLLQSGAGLEEYDPLGELVHRATRLALLRRYGRLPDWLRLGLAWDMELALRKKIYCFPARTSFIGVAEHTGWDKSLRAYLRSDDGPASLVEALSAVSTKTFAAEGAWLAQGVVSYLVAEEPERLPELADAFARDRRQGSVVVHGDGTWTSNVSYAPSGEAQREILAGVLGADFEERLRGHLDGTAKKSRRKARK